jgi:hypothetical protein
MQIHTIGIALVSGLLPPGTAADNAAGSSAVAYFPDKWMTDCQIQDIGLCIRPREFVVAGGSQSEKDWAVALRKVEGGYRRRNREAPLQPTAGSKANPEDYARISYFQQHLSWPKIWVCHLAEAQPFNTLV